MEKETKIMEKETTTERNVKLTLEKAKEWYKQGGELKEVALQAFAENELCQIDKPRTWEEYCDKTIRGGKYFINTDSLILSKCYCEDLTEIETMSADEDKNLLPSKELAKAFLAYMQLMSLRKAWIRKLPISYVINDWYYIKEGRDAKIISDIIVKPMTDAVESLSFPSQEMAAEFKECFKDLLETAKGLY